LIQIEKKMELGADSNTPPTIPLEKSLIACVDWVSITFFEVHFWQEVAHLLNVPESEFEECESGRNGYRKMVKCGNILIMYDGNRSNSQGSQDMGIHLDISGQGCREYENRFSNEWDWTHLFALLLNFKIKFSRLDIALDDFFGYFTLHQLYLKIRKGEISSKFKRWKNFESGSISTGEIDGQTIYLGTDDIMFRFYDKKSERENKGYEISQEVTFWNRYEIQLRHQRANTAAYLLGNETFKIGQFAVGLFSEYVNVKIRNNNEKKKSRWKNTKWWDTFINGVEKVKLYQVPPEKNIVKSQRWLTNDVSTTLAMVYYAHDENSDIIKSLLNRGTSKLKRKHWDQIEQFKLNEFMKSYSKQMRYEDNMQYAQEVVDDFDYLDYQKQLSEEHAYFEMLDFLNERDKKTRNHSLVE